MHLGLDLYPGPSFKRDDLDALIGTQSSRWQRNCDLDRLLTGGGPVGHRLQVLGDQTERTQRTYATDQSSGADQNTQNHEGSENPQDETRNATTRTVELVYPGDERTRGHDPLPIAAMRLVLRGFLTSGLDRWNVRQLCLGRGREGEGAVIALAFHVNKHDRTGN